jgi:hypothetical protein
MIETAARRKRRATAVRTDVKNEPIESIRDFFFVEPDSTLLGKLIDSLLKGSRFFQA